MNPRIDRRTALKLGAGAIAAAVGGCGSSPHNAAAPTTRGGPATTSAGPATTLPTTATLTPTTTAEPAISTADWSTLAASLAGRLVRPTDSTYLTDLQLYDSRYDSVRPQAIAYCSSATDVQRCLGFATERNLPFAARSGGHSYAGYSTSSGLVIDVTAINDVSVGTGATTATIGAGARLIDIYSALNGAGVSIPGGSCPTVGIAGLTLGGGQGVVGRAHGLTCDALNAVTLVTADGQLVTADAQNNPDLFWACRGGGGGNFGIATSFVFSTFPTSSVTVTSYTWPWSAAADVLPAWIEWASAAPDQMWSNCLLQARPGFSSPQVVVGTVWIGSPAAVSVPLESLRQAVGTAPSSSYAETVAFGHAMYVEGGCASLGQAACHLPSQNPAGVLTRQPSLAKSGYIDRPLSDAGVAAFLAGIETSQAAGGNGAVGFDAYGGAINRVDPAATAFVHRSALASAQFNVPFTPGTSPEVLAAGEAYLRDWYASVQPYLDGEAYQNYIDPGLTGWADAYYGANLARLAEVKRTWDPDGVFRFAQAIPVA